MSVSKTVKISDSLSIGVQLALVGGFTDAYSFINRGSVFATGQTGNLVLIGIRISEGNFYGSFMALVPIIFFVIGVFAYEYIIQKFKDESNESWPCYILTFEIVIMYLVGLLPSTLPDIYANSSIAFASALQFCSFRTLVNSPYATVFCSGNIRSCAEMYYKGIFLKNKEALISANRYIIIIVSFLIGGILSSFLSMYLEVKTIWICCLLLLIPLVNIRKDVATVHQVLKTEK